MPRVPESKLTPLQLEARGASPESWAMAQATMASDPWESMSSEDRSSVLDSAEPILGGGYETKKDIEKLLNDHGSIRVWQTHPAVQDFLKNRPDDVEHFELKEMLPGGYQGDPNEPGTVVIRKRSMGALTS